MDSACGLHHYQERSGGQVVAAPEGGRTGSRSGAVQALVTPWPPTARPTLLADCLLVLIPAESFPDLPWNSRDWNSRHFLNVGKKTHNPTVLHTLRVL